MIKTSLFLSEAYKDAWCDYQRSLCSESFPVWDYIILTASNAHQAQSFQKQIDARRGLIPSRTVISIIPDEGNVRVGSGGATLSVLKWLKERDSFEGKRILVIHSGGDSKRVPQYSTLGKLFSPVPHKLPDGRGSTLFDEFIITMSAVPGRIREGMLLLSGDVLLLFNPLLIDYSGHGAAVLSFKEDVEVGKEHGVFLRGEDGCVKQFLHKQTPEKLRAVGAVNDAGTVDIDTGAVLFGVDVINALYALICDNGAFSEERYRKYVNDTVRLNLYGDFQYPMATGSTLDQFYLEKPEGDDSPELRACRTDIWNALHRFPLKLMRFAPAKFIHFGTTREILQMMCGGVNAYSELGWSAHVNCNVENRFAGYNSVVSPRALIGDGCYFEVSYVHGGAEVGEGCVLSYIDIHEGEVIPPHTVLHGLKQMNGNFVCRIYGTDDNPKENRLFGRELKGDLWDEGAAHTLWNAKIYPECRTIREAVSSALALYRAITQGGEIPRGKSLCSGFNDADMDAVIAWDKRMKELVQMNHIEGLIDAHAPAQENRLKAPLTKIQGEWLENSLRRADFSKEMRLHYYIGKALGGAAGEKEMALPFSIIRNAILKQTLSGLKENTTAKIAMDELVVSLPLRVNWGGGWSDTPPYCNERGGTVLNAAILLNNKRPVTVTLRKLTEKKIVLTSADMDAYGEYTDIGSLQSVGDPFDVHVLQKAALLACGIIPAEGGTLEAVLDRLGGGLWMETTVTGVPKGSGLGTSSILASACVKALFQFYGITCTDNDIYAHVLCMEQIMSTGGGWQDQVGGLTDGIKFITSRPGLVQKPCVHYLNLDERTFAELNDRFVLIYTGQRRLARNILRDVVGRYIGNEPDALYALNEIQRVAALMRFELERGNVDEFAKLLSQHWELSKMIDAGSTNRLIDQIFSSIDDLVEGKMVCGAGGGGFLQTVLKKGSTRQQLQERLQAVFQDTDISVWNCELV